VDVSDEEDEFSCTKISLAPIHHEWTDETKNTGIIHSYVLMNMTRNCLLRRNH
jgi:hypothetical protein